MWPVTRLRLYLGRTQRPRMSGDVLRWQLEGERAAFLTARLRAL